MLVTAEQAFANFMFARALKRGYNVRRSTRRRKNRALDASRRVTSRMCSYLRYSQRYIEMIMNRFRYRFLL